MLIHIDRGFLTDVTAHKPQRPAPLEHWRAEQAGWNVQERARVIRGIASLVRQRRETIEEAKAGELPTEEDVEEKDGIEAFREIHRVRSESELIDRLEAKLEGADERRWRWARG